MTGIPVVRTALLLFLGFYALHENFLLGQNYVFLLFLFTAAFWCLLTHRDFASGVVLGTVCALKLFSAPFLLYFAWKRKWKAAAGMVIACLLLAGVSIAVFGWQDNYYFLTQIVPRSLDGDIIDPYNSATATFTVLLRRIFLSEPELNPRTLCYWPAGFFVLKPLIGMMVLGSSILCLPRSSENEKRDFAWFMIALMLASPYTAPYLFVLLYLPVVLLMENARSAPAAWLAAAYAVLAAPLYPQWWMDLFPKAVFLLALFIAVGGAYWTNAQRRDLVVAGLIVLAATAWDARVHFLSYSQEPARTFGQVAVEEGAIYSSSPAISRNDMVYGSIGEERYMLRRIGAAGDESLTFEGQAFHPALSFMGGTVYFELVAQRSSRIVKYSPALKKLDVIVPPSMSRAYPAVSQDGKLLAFVSGGRIVIYDGANFIKLATPGFAGDPAFFPGGGEIAYAGRTGAHSYIFATEIATGRTRQLTDAPDDQSEPAIPADGKYLAFTSNASGPKAVWVKNLSTAA